MTPPGLDVRAFSPDNFLDAIRSTHISRAEVSAHKGVDYLIRYLTELRAESIVVEHEYTDADYLDDYAAYYVKSFQDYGRRCKRLHFFAEALEAETLTARLMSAVPDLRLQQSYLGFVVARPLPQAVVGRTVLATYPPDGGRRHYPSTREYTAHLFGAQLSIESLAFQEQDTVLAACATVAIWSALHKAAVLFGTRAPSPAQITRSANQGLYLERALPSRGLNPSQMARAVSEAGLEPEVFQCSSRLPLLSLLHGYLGLGVSPVLGIDIEGHGLHAVAVTGYSLRPTRIHKFEELTGHQIGLRRVGLRIDELYVHDDGCGPFARIAVRTRKPKKVESAVYFDGTWSSPGSAKPARLEPTFVVVPVYHKVRLTFLDVQAWLTFFHRIVELTLNAATMRRGEWQVTLSTTNDVKRDLRSSGLDAADLRRVLFRQQPRFLWRATFSLQGAPYVELLFDATDMQRSVPLHDALFHNSGFGLRIRRTIESLLSMPILPNGIGFKPFLQAILDTFE